MKRPSIIKIIIVSAICIALIVTTIILSLQNRQVFQAVVEEVIPDWNRLKASFAERNSESGEEVYLVQGENISLTETEVDVAVDLEEMQGWRIDRAYAAVELLNAKALHHYAVSIGVEPTAANVRNSLNQLRARITYQPSEIALDNGLRKLTESDDVNNFIEWTGLSQNEFWDLHRGIAKYEAVPNLLQQYFIDNYTSAESHEDITWMTAEELNRFNEEYSAWLENIQTQILADEGIDLDEVRGRLR